jgi:hypothetical protein
MGSDSWFPSSRCARTSRSRCRSAAEFLIGLGAGVPAAFAVTLIALPFLDAATRHDTVRLE